MADESLDAIFNDITKDFSIDSINLIKQDLIKYKQVFIDLLAGLEFVSGTKVDHASIMRNAYRVIMAAREYFTGQEPIVYRIYYAANNRSSSFNKNVGIYELTEEELLNLTTKEGSALRLKASFTKALEERMKQTEREAIFDNHWMTVYNGLQEVKAKQTAYVVHKFIFEMYYQKNPGLYLVDSEYPYKYATFNRGNIYESFDATVEVLYKDKVKSVGENMFQDRYFGVELRHDQVKGFQTGDIGSYQLKARHAQLIEANTLKLYLKDIILILSDSNLTSDKIYEIIKKDFTDPEKESLDPALNEHIEQISINLVKETISTMPA